MGLSHDIISQFAKLVNSDNNKSSESILFGTVVIGEDGGKYVKPDGSDQLIPLSNDDEDPVKENTTTNINDGNRVSVLIKDHNATVTGNISYPSASNSDIDTKITEFDIAVGQQIQAKTAYFKDLISDNASIGELIAAIVEVSELIANDANIKNLQAGKVTVTDLIATKIDTDIVIADEAIIEHLKAGSIDVLSLIADKATIEQLITNKANINTLIAQNADLKYADIKFSNIEEATISKLFTDYGVIRELTIEEGTVVKELVGVTIKGDLIEANTLKADKLVVKGSDGLYYKLNVDALGEATASFDEKYQNGLDGSVIIAESITAEKISVDDLVAFGATIGGFKIGDNSLYSGVKSSVDNTTPGVYMDSDGQFAVGDGNNYIRFQKKEDESYKLDIGVSKVDTGAGVELTDTGLVVKKIDNHGNNIGDTVTNINHEGMTVNDTASGDDMLTANKDGVNAKNLHANTYLIVGKDGRSRFEDYTSADGSKRTACFWIGGSLDG